MIRGTEEFTDAEMQTLVMACVDGAVGGGVAEDDLEAFAQWCDERRFDWVIVQLVLAGRICVRRNTDGEWVFLAREALERGR